VARAGEPFSAIAEGASAGEATRQLEAILRQRLQSGSAVATIELSDISPAADERPFCLEALPEDDWFFKTMREAIEENRQRENQADGRIPGSVAVDWSR
jgi:uncharacterized protein (DUF1697 family)